ncbi:MAG: helix-turn-helix domain containing protein [Chloroflexi bacterium]|nr:helix-turn-helix domain containing protein [Chloroflexota bacterium]
MPHRLSLTPHRSTGELARGYRACRDPVERSHWQMVWLVSQGHTCPAVARMMGYRADSVRAVVHRYNTEGPAGLVDRRHTNPGQPPLVADDDREALRERLAAPPPDGGLWTGPKVAAWLSERLGRPVSPQRAWEVLRAIDYTLQRPRPRAAKADPAAQAAFKKGA